MSSRTPFLVESDDEDEERNNNELRIMVSNESYEYIDEGCYSCTPWMTVLSLAVAAFLGLVVITWPSRTYAAKSCDSVTAGYSCSPEISHYWGQYSSYFSVPSDYTNDVPQSCNITFAQVLSRHGGRYPTSRKSLEYASLIHHIKASVRNFNEEYSFLKDYEYALGAEDLTVFGEQQMVNSGEKFFQQYISLASQEDPFYRSASGERVIESTLKFSQGFAAAKSTSTRVVSPVIDLAHLVIIDEAKNNTLSHGTCPAFEDPRPHWEDTAEAVWAHIFIPPIQERLNQNLPGADLTLSQTIYMMDLCPFETMASPYGSLSPFCDLFTEEEWREYDYYQALNKYYGFSFGAPLGPTQGVGWVNELIARLTNSTVQDATNTNRTLDGDARTFPLDRKLYADFSHDNDMVSIFSAMGLYNVSMTFALSRISQADAEQVGGFSASWIVPFAARMYVEKMVCGEAAEEMVRVLVNDRVVPLQGCGADELGRCRVDRWVESLGFARSNGLWSKCFRVV